MFKEEATEKYIKFYLFLSYPQILINAVGKINTVCYFSCQYSALIKPVTSLCDIKGHRLASSKRGLQSENIFSTWGITLDCTEMNQSTVIAAQSSHLPFIFDMYRLLNRMEVIVLPTP